MIEGNARDVNVIEVTASDRRANCFQKLLDRIGGPTLYKNARAAARGGENQMLTSWTHKEHTTKRRPTAAMRGVCLGVQPSSSPVNIFDGRLGQAASIDSRHLRH
jgi:hypothetical protein